MNEKEKRYVSLVPITDKIDLETRLYIRKEKLSYVIEKLIAIGASTGGPQAIQKILTSFKNPINVPTRTSRGECPINSRNLSSSIFLWARRSSIIRLSIFACTPIERRQVWASNIVIIAKMQLKAKIGEL